MAMSFQQNGIGAAAGYLNAGCSGRSLAAGFGSAQALQATSGGVAGAGGWTISLASSATNVAAMICQCVVPSGTTWAAGTWTVRLNITSANMNLTLNEVYVCRANSAGTNQATIGSATALGISLGTTGAISVNVSGSSQAASAGDGVNIIFVVSNGAMSSQLAGVTADQLIDSPFAGVTAHATTGVLTGQSSTVSGAAAVKKTHTTTGVLTGPGAAIVGSAQHKARHATSGALRGQGSTVVGAARRNSKHPTTGVITGAGTTVAGTSKRFRTHANSGVLPGRAAVISGAARRTRTHATTGVLPGKTSSVAGTAARTHVHLSTGVISGPGASVAGASTRTGASTGHATSGTLTGQGASVVGSAKSLTGHSTTGVLAAQGALVVGSSARTGTAVTHATSGVLTGPGATLSGSSSLVLEIGPVVTGGASPDSIQRRRRRYILPDGQVVWATKWEIAEILATFEEREIEDEVIPEVKPEPKIVYTTVSVDTPEPIRITTRGLRMDGQGFSPDSPNYEEVLNALQKRRFEDEFMLALLEVI